jgi:hypothetical protein
MYEYIQFPTYIHRTEEQGILGAAEQLRADGKSRVLLLYGEGGSGKTWLIRELVRERRLDRQTIWVDTVDVDDSEYWLLSKLETHVAEQLDPDGHYFREYHEYISRLPSYTRPRIGHETVVSHLNRIKRVFQDCYRDFVTQTGSTVVISFDTVETIRHTYLLVTLTQWMKALPATLFILAGRPPHAPPGEGNRADAEVIDPIRNELEDPHHGMPVTTIRLGTFSEEMALRYLDGSSLDTLDREEKAKLILLTRGQPLWLAFAIAYLQDRGMPQEAVGSLAALQESMPFGGELSHEGQALHEAFKRRLMTPYRETDFWHEAVKRLAIVRQRVNQQIWQQLMVEWELPADVPTWEAGWEELLGTPWVRPRANRRYVTLHDAVAEELGQRIIPLHDLDLQWPRALWTRAAAIYRELTDEPMLELDEKLTALDSRLQDLDAVAGQNDEAHARSQAESAFVDEVAELAVRKHELDQLRAVGLFYLLLSDFRAGCSRFLELLAEAKKRHDVLFQDLLALEMQRFLPGGVQTYAFGDVVGVMIENFRTWLREQADLHREIGLGLAEYLIYNEQPGAADALLRRLPAQGADFDHRYRLQILLGNALMRIPGQVRNARAHFTAALAEANELRPPECYKHIAEAQKELGFYYRNAGMWRHADNAYREARDAISAALGAGGSEEDREEMASIQTNWAYVKGLEGGYRDGTNLVESAITVRRRLGQKQGEAISWSVCGEVYRYERRFELAWSAYENAEQIFQEQRNWSWLGLIYQEQAICLFQAAQDRVTLTPDRDQIGQAKRLITLALGICREQAVRGYPSALNRAGRIFGHEDRDHGLAYLEEGIGWARRLSDGWFWFANLIEHVELSYRAWTETGQPHYRTAIESHAADVEQALSEYAFPDLQGRWLLVQAHLGIHDWEETGGPRLLADALAKYTDGFAMIAQSYVGSSGAAAIPGLFVEFGKQIALLPPDIQAEWLRHLRREWGRLTRGSDLLLARLEELY